MFEDILFFLVVVPILCAFIIVVWWMFFFAIAMVIGDIKEWRLSRKLKKHERELEELSSGPDM